MKVVKITLVILLICLILLAFFGYRAYVGFGVAGLPEGITSEVWTDSLVDQIPVAIDIAPDGRIFAATTGMFSQGAGDNRQQSFWLMDDRKSMSVADREAYIQKWIAAGELTEEWFTEVHDEIVVYEDSDGDGVGDTASVFATISGLLNGVTAGVLVHNNDVFITSIPNVLRYRDTDGDNVADEETVLSTGYGLRTAFVGHDLHGLTQGPDGKIYYSVGDRGFNVTTSDGRVLKPDMDFGRGGVFRMNPDGSELELFHQGLRNPQELAFDQYGNLFSGDNNSDGDDAARIVYVTEGGDSGWSDGYQYQAQEDYLRGPWNAEKMWQPHHKNQPAWITPPVANLTNGPSGFSYYPGTGLPERYNQHFFLSDYGFAAMRSSLWSFALNPKGAGFEMVDAHEFATNELFIDQDFGYDGKLYAISAPVIGGAKRIRTFFDPLQQGAPELVEVTQLFSEGFDQQSDERLLALLSHVDQRVRLQAQFELVKRNRETALNAVAVDSAATELARIHAIWGLGQLKAQTAVASWGDLSLFEGEVLAQALKVIGDAQVITQRDTVRQLLGHDNPRVQYFAAMAAGKLHDQAAISDLMQLAETAGANDDPYLRHAVVWALAKIGDRGAVQQFVNAASAERRMAVLLTLRRWRDGDIAVFLQDSDPQLVVEAARAIYDLPIPEAVPALAALAITDAPLQSSDPQSAYALHRRIIHAAVLLGGEQGADYLLRYASNEANDIAMREEALAAFKDYTQPPELDAVVGWYRPINERPETLVHAAIDRWVPALLEGELSEAALAAAVRYNRVPLDDDQLLALIGDKEEKPRTRISGLEALQQSETAITSGDLEKAADLALNSGEPGLQAAGLRALAQSEADKAVSLAIDFASPGQNLFLQQQAIMVLAQVQGTAAEQWLATALEKLATHKHTPGTGLELIAAAEQFDSALIGEKLALYRASLPPGDVVAARHTTLVGGDPDAGRMKFQTGGDCLRCHAVDGKGGNVGPDLAGIASRHDARYLLEALVTPDSAVAPGFGQVSLTLKDGTAVSGLMVGETDEELQIRAQSSHGEGEASTFLKSDILSQDGPVSGMPAMGLVLPDADVRNIMAYLQTLQ